MATRSFSSPRFDQVRISCVGMATARPMAVVSNATQMPPASSEESTALPADVELAKGLDHAEHGAEQPQQRRDLGDGIERTKPRAAGRAVATGRSWRFSCSTTDRGGTSARPASRMGRRHGFRETGGGVRFRQAEGARTLCLVQGIERFPGHDRDCRRARDELDQLDDDQGQREDRQGHQNGNDGAAKGQQAW